MYVGGGVNIQPYQSMLGTQGKKGTWFPVLSFLNTLSWPLTPDPVGSQVKIKITMGKNCWAGRVPDLAGSDSPDGSSNCQDL